MCGAFCLRILGKVIFLQVLPNIYPNFSLYVHLCVYVHAHSQSCDIRGQFWKSLFSLYNTGSGDSNSVVRPNGDSVYPLSLLAGS